MPAAHVAPRLSERAPLAPAMWRARAPSLALWMVLTIGAVALVAYWDEQREFSAALRDFAGEQTALAQAVATALRAELVGTTVRIGSHSEEPRARATASDSARLELTRTVARFLAAERPVERPRSLRVLVQSPFDPGLETSTGPTLRSTAIEAGLATGAASLRLGRSEAFDLGLPARLAMAGLAQFEAGDAGKWGIAVVASAESERDREVLAQLRLALSVVVASGLVLAFGGLALRNQRKRLLLSQELAVASVQSERNDRLVRADKLATMGALATGIAHEVSTPLGVIVGRAEQLLSRSHGDERATRAARAIVEQAERITSIVRGFLALARGDAPRTEHVAPKTLGEVSVDLVGHRFAKAGVRLTTALGDALPPVACEPHLMEQVLVNLLLNACDACKPGGNVELKIVAEGQRVAFVVTDDGTGISPDAAARILDPFFTTKPPGQGSGLGLAIASELVKHHRGTLSVAARSGQHGTRACVELPSALEASSV